MSRDDGGSAFPVLVQIDGDGNPNGVLTSGSDGMTLRDYFAAHALDGRLLSANWDMHVSDIARRAYMLADAMLLERDWEDGK